MALFGLQIPAIVFGIAWVVWSVLSLKSRPLRIVERLLFVGGCFLLFNFYLMPLPLNALGLESISDSLVPLDEAIRIVPFAQLLADKNYLTLHFAPYWVLFGGAALIGFSTNLVTKKPLPLWKNALVAFLIPFGGFAIHAIIRLATGVMWKRADVTDIIWFMLCYAIGYGVYLLGRKTFGKKQANG